MRMFNEVSRLVCLKVRPTDELACHLEQTRVE